MRGRSGPPAAEWVKPCPSHARGHGRRHANASADKDEPKPTDERVDKGRGFTRRVRTFVGG